MFQISPLRCPATYSKLSKAFDPFQRHLLDIAQITITISSLRPRHCIYHSHLGKYAAPTHPPTFSLYFPVLPRQCIYITPHTGNYAHSLTHQLSSTEILFPCTIPPLNVSHSLHRQLRGIRIPINFQGKKAISLHSPATVPITQKNDKILPLSKSSYIIQRTRTNQ